MKVTIVVMHRVYLPVVIFVILYLSSASLFGVGPAASVYITVNPDAIIADGASVTTVSAEIRDSSGVIVPDGTNVSFSTSLGTIQNTSNTASGVARARLTSGTEIGTATVSAWVTQGGAVGQAKVELLAPGTEISRESFMTISAGYLIYDGTTMIVYAEGGVRISHRGMTITADEAQINVAAATVKCRRNPSGNPVSLQRSHKSMDANLVFYQMTEMKGYMLAEGDSGRIERLMFRGSDLATDVDDGSHPQNLYDFVDVSQSPYIIKASSITIRPSKDIQFRRAKVYIDGKKVLSVPLHVIPMGSSSAQKSRYLGWGTNGLRVDVPFYYSLSPTSTGSVHLRRGQQAGWGFYSANSGFSVDLVQDYTTDSGSEGSFVLNRLTSGDWGAHWQHNQEIGSDGRLYTYLDFPSHRDIFGTVNINKQLSKGNLGISLYGNKYKDASASATTDVYVQSLSKPILGGAVNYVLLAKTSYATGGNTTTDGVGAGLQAQLYGKQLSFSSKTRLSNSVSFGHDWGGSRPGFRMLANSRLAHRLGKMGEASLGYSYTGDSNMSETYGRHRLNASLMYLPSDELQFRVFSSYTLDESLSSSFADITYKFDPKWRLNLLQTFQKYDQYGYSDTEIALGRAIGDNEITLIWSKSKDKFRVEFSTLRF